MRKSSLIHIALFLMAAVMVLSPLPESRAYSAEPSGWETEKLDVAAVLEAAGTSLENVVKTTCFLAEMADFAAFNSVYEKYFTGKPARSCVAVKQLPKNVLVEVEVIAAAE